MVAVADNGGGDSSMQLSSFHPLLPAMLTRVMGLHVSCASHVHTHRTYKTAGQPSHINSKLEIYDMLCIPIMSLRVIV